MNFCLPHGEIIPGARDKKIICGWSRWKGVLRKYSLPCRKLETHCVWQYSWVVPGRQAQAWTSQLSDEAEGNIWGHVQGRRHWRYASCTEGTGEKELSGERALSSWAFLRRRSNRDIFPGLSLLCGLRNHFWFIILTSNLWHWQIGYAGGEKKG